MPAQVARRLLLNFRGVLAGLGCNLGETKARGPILSPPRAPSPRLWVLGTNLGFIWGNFCCVQRVNMSLSGCTPAMWPVPQFPLLHSCPGAGECTAQLGKGERGQDYNKRQPPASTTTIQPHCPHPSVLLIEPSAGGGAGKRGWGRRAARGPEWC